VFFVNGFQNSRIQKYISHSFASLCCLVIMGNTLPKSLFVFHFQKKGQIMPMQCFRLLQRQLFGTKSNSVW
jgi:hypothetical protein